MRYLKALAFVAAAGLMAFIGVGTASASVLCSTTADPCPSAQRWPNGTALEFTLAAGTSSNFKEPGPEGSTLQTCTGSAAKGALTNGSSSATASGLVESANWTTSGCTFPTKNIHGGTIEVHKIVGTSNGTVTASGFEVTELIFGFIDCVYKTGNGLDLGTLTEGKPAVVHVETTVTSSNGVCPESVEWFATYTLTSPKETTLSVSSS